MGFSLDIFAEAYIQKINMSNIKRLFYLAFLLSVMSCSGDDSQDNREIYLKLNLNVGDRFIVTTQVRTKSSSLQSYDSYNKVKFKVDSAFADYYLFKALLMEISSEAKSGYTTISYDSQKPVSQMTDTEKEIHDEYRELLNNAVNIILKNNNEFVSPRANDSVSDVKKEIMDMRYLTLHYPKTKLKAGSTWEKEVISGLLSQKQLFKYTIKEITNREVVIDLGITMKGLTGSIDGKGQYTVDAKTGRIKKADIRMNLEEGSKVDITIRVKQL